MKLRFNSEAEIDLVPRNRLYRGANKANTVKVTKGLIVLESSPQIRTIFTGGNKGFVRLPFPYVLYVVGYRRKEEKYVYPGVFDAGLRVFFRNSPMEKYTDPVFYPPMDALNFGVVCTPHDHDEKVFDDLPSLANHAITLWWNMIHNYGISNEWKDFSIEECLNHNWNGATPSLSFPNALEKFKDTGHEFLNIYYPPDNSELVNESWPPVTTLVGANNETTI